MKVKIGLSKKCITCGKPKRNKDFYNCKRNKDGLKSQCKSCTRPNEVAYRQNKSRLHTSYKLWKTRNPESYLVCSAKGRARRNNQEFSITKEDVKIPNVCPILGIPLFAGGFRNPNSPSIDRIDNSKGYTKGNIQVISYRANVLKNDGSIKELKALANWVLRKFK